MRYFFLVICCLGFSIFCEAQELMKHKKKGKYGFVEKSHEKKKKVIIPYQFQKVGTFKNGLCPAKKDGFWGYIDEKGNTVYPFELDEADDFSSSTALVVKNGKYGAVNLKGEVAIPISFDTLTHANGHFIFHENDKSGVMDSVGNKVLAAEYDEVKMGYPDYLIARKGGQFFQYQSGDLLEKNANELVFRKPDLKPSFKGCDNFIDKREKEKCAEEKMLMFVYKQIKYPALARDKGVEGMVVAGFTIDSNGNVGDAKILRDIGAGCGEEVLRLVQTMPKWNPGMEEGQTVGSYFFLPVRFRLE